MIPGLGLAATCLTAGVWLLAYRALVRQHFDAFSILLLFFGFIFLGRGFMLGLGLDTPAPDYLFDTWQNLLVEAQLLASAWLVVLIVSAHVLRPMSAVAANLFPAAPAVLDTRRMLLLSALFSGIGILITAILLHRYGGINELVRAAKYQKELAGTFFLRQFPALGALLAVSLLLVLSGRRRADPKQRNIPFAAAALGLLAFDSFAVFLWGDREPIAVLLFALVVGRSYFVKRHSLGVLGAQLGTIFLALIGLRFLRDIFTAGRIFTLDDDNPFRVVAESMHGIRLDAFMLALRDWIGQMELRAGEDFVMGVLGAVPRALWTDKPDVVVPGAWFRQYYEPDIVNGWPFTVIGEWMINFGYAGLLFGAALTAVVFAAVQMRYGDLRNNPVGFVATVTISLMVFQTVCGPSGRSATGYGWSRCSCCSIWSAAAGRRTTYQPAI